MTDIQNNDVNRFKPNDANGHKKIGKLNPDGQSSGTPQQDAETPEKPPVSAHHVNPIDPDAILNQLGLMSHTQKAVLQGQASSARSLQEFHQTFQRIMEVIDNELPDQLLSPKSKELLALQVLNRKYLS